MPRLRGARGPVRAILVALSVVLLTATAACGPPAPRAHYGPLPTRIASWEMGRNLPIFVGISDDALSRGGAGWDTESAALNEPGNIVLFGHRVSKGAPFRTLDLLHPGHLIVITGSDGRTYTYRVVTTRITAPSWSEVLAWQSSNGRGLTLVACHPPGSISYRIVVHAELVIGS